MTEELLPCPFCGNPPKFEIHADHPKLGKQNPWFFIGCCHTYKPGDIENMPDAIRKWNTRALSKMQKVDLDKMRQFGLGDASWEANFRYSYNRAIDDIKSKFGDLYAEVKE